MAKKQKCEAMKSLTCGNTAKTQIVRAGVEIPSCWGCFNFEQNLKANARHEAHKRIVKTECA